jgi:preprotein translocase subunit SecE
MADAESKPDAKTPAPRTSPLQFLQEVRTEAGKVTWPTRKETTVTTIMVFIMVVLAMLFFFFVDYVIFQGLQLLIPTGR